MKRITDKILFALTQKLTTRTIKFLSQKQNLHTPKRTVRTFSIDSESSYSISENFVEGYYELLTQFMNQILTFNEFQEFARYIHGNKRIRNQDTSFQLIKYESQPYRMTYHMLFCQFMERYFVLTGSIQFNVDSFLLTYLELESYFFGKTEFYTVTSPLVNFFSDVDKISLDSNLIIRKLTQAEKNDFMKTKYNFPVMCGPLDGVNPMQFSFTLQTDFQYDKSKPFDNTFGMKTFQDVIIALRLFKKGTTDFTCLRYETSSWQPVFQNQYGDSNNPRVNERLPYRLSEEETGDLIRFWKIYKRLRDSWSSYVQIAIRRFDLAIEESDLEDKITDFSIALEALYLNDNQEVKYKLSNRIAILLGQTDNDRNNIKNLVKDAYELRSSIVHGADIRNHRVFRKYSNTEEFLEWLEEISRQSIHRFLSLSLMYDKQQLSEELDKSLLSAKSMKELQRLAKKKKLAMKKQN